MDVYATIKIRLNNWCDPDDFDFSKGETLASLTESMLLSEGIIDEDSTDGFELIDVRYIHPQQLSLDTELRKTEGFFKGGLS